MPEDRISPVDDCKTTEDLLTPVKSQTKELASRTFEDSNPIRQKDSFYGNSFVEPIQKEDSSNDDQSGMIPVQTKTTSTDKSEKGNNSEAFYAASFDYSKIASTSDSIDVRKIDNENNAWEWIHVNIGVV